MGLREAISEETNRKLRLSTEVQAATASILPQSGVSGGALLVSVTKSAPSIIEDI